MAEASTSLCTAALQLTYSEKQRSESRKKLVESELKRDCHHLDFI